jgi:molybdopterin-synthase adenylyltransferase
MIEAQQVYAINPAVDVYKIGDDTLEFYFITTRRRVTLEVSPSVVTLINAIDGETSLSSLCASVDIPLKEEVLAFIHYLLKEKILFEPHKADVEKKLLAEQDLVRYERQLNYFDSSFPDSSYHIQKRLQEDVFLVLGVGAIGAGIALQLVMSGVRNLILIDKDRVSKDTVERHFTFKISDIGRPKVEALADYLKEIDNKVLCTTYYQLVDFDTPLDAWLKKATFVVNTMDEPYLGITSLKVGRACLEKRLPLYVAGGFDAHLMSTGELIVPRVTPCVDCYTSFLTETLKDWQPKYNMNAITEQEYRDNIFEVGGLASMSLFSISYAVIVILNYIATGDALYSRGRGDLLFDELHIHYLNISKNPNCDVCRNL